MRRVALTERPGWQGEIQALGVDLAASPQSPYWREDAAYELTSEEIDALHDAAVEIERLVGEAVEHVVKHDRLEGLGLPANLAAVAAESWRNREPSLYGRYDLRFDGAGPPKLLEYNADTPTALFEASVVQWHWLEACYPGHDQFNSIHEALIETWADWRRSGRLARVHFACFPDDDDDLLTTAYLMDTAVQAELDAVLLDVPDIGWDGRVFVDLDQRRIDALFKLYPWDWMADDAFFEHIRPSRIRVVEPAWRVIASSKALLAVLWELFPGHENLLPASMIMASIPPPRIMKPVLGREGANVVIEGASRAACSTDGPYEAMLSVTQAFDPLPEFDGWRPVIGAWMVNGRPHGIGIREDRNLVTGRQARFVPHVIVDP
jgi:glutathionylspermidine synthase